MLPAGLSNLRPGPGCSHHSTPLLSTRSRRFTFTGWCSHKLYFLFWVRQLSGTAAKQRVALEHYRHPFLCIFFTSWSASVSSACFRASRSRRARFSQSHSRDVPIPNAATATTSRRPRRMVGSSTFDLLRDMACGAPVFRDSRKALGAMRATFDVRLSRQRLDRAARQRPAQRHHAGQFRVPMLDPDMLAVRLKRCRNARR